MKKFCVFCGQKPSSKHKEHIIPQWLIELTGDPNRLAIFSNIFDIQEMRLVQKEFAFDQFKFPSCAKCNEEYSDFENKAREVVLRILDDDALSATDFIILLDWLDKIRVGLWLAYNYLQKNIAEVDPNYHIDKRIGVSDRAVLIYKLDTYSPGINFGGVNLPAFQYYPICYNLRINQYSFFNLSTHFLISKHLGFPYPRESFYTEGSSIRYSMVEGKNRILYPLIRKHYDKKCTEIYQPIFSLGASLPNLEENYNNNHIRSLSYNYAKGIGKILIAKNNKIFEYPSEKSNEWAPNFEWDGYDFMEMIGKQVLDFQIYLINRGSKYGDISSEKTKLIKEQLSLAKRINRLYTNLLDED